MIITIQPKIDRLQWIHALQRLLGRWSTTDVIMLGSARLALYGLVQNSDLDLVVHDGILERFEEMGDFEWVDKPHGKILCHKSLDIEVTSKYELFNMPWVEVKSRSKLIEGYRFLDWDFAYQSYILMGREKDAAKAAMIRDLFL